jgi:hypothetical protein
MDDIEPERIVVNDTKYYFAINIDKKPLCRLYFNTKQQFNSISLLELDNDKKDLNILALRSAFYVGLKTRNLQVLHPVLFLILQAGTLAFNLGVARRYAQRRRTSFFLLLACLLLAAFFLSPFRPFVHSPSFLVPCSLHLVPYFGRLINNDWLLINFEKGSVILKKIIPLPTINKDKRNLSNEYLYK